MNPLTIALAVIALVLSYLITGGGDNQLLVFLGLGFLSLPGVKLLVNNQASMALRKDNLDAAFSAAPKPGFLFPAGGLQNPTEAYRIFLRGLLGAYFGRFDVTHQTLDALLKLGDSSAASAFCQALGGVLACLEEGSFAQGYIRFKRCSELLQQSLGGAVFSSRSSVQHIAQGAELLVSLDSSPNFALASALEAGNSRFPALDRPFVLWCLATFYRQAGRADDAERLSEQLRKLAPHCAGLRVA